MYLDQNKREQIINTIAHKVPSLSAIWLFGSYAKGEATRKSDIDIAYLSTENLKKLEIWEISQILSSLLSTDVDLIDIAQTNTTFRYQIISTGERIWGGGEEVEFFETLAYSFYLRFHEERRPIVDEIKKNQRIIASKESPRV